MFQESSTPIEAEIPPSQSSTNQEESVERMDEDSTPEESCTKKDENSTQGDKTEESASSAAALNTSEVRLVPECDEDDDVVIPMPDDDCHRWMKVPF